MTTGAFVLILTTFFGVKASWGSSMHMVSETNWWLEGEAGGHDRHVSMASPEPNDRNRISELHFFLDTYVSRQSSPICTH